MLSQLYTISGRQLRVYDPVTNTVTTKASLPTDRGIGAATKAVRGPGTTCNTSHSSVSP